MAKAACINTAEPTEQPPAPATNLHEQLLNEMAEPERIIGNLIRSHRERPRFPARACKRNALFDDAFVV